MSRRVQSQANFHDAGKFVFAYNVQQSNLEATKMQYTKQSKYEIKPIPSERAQAARPAINSLEHWMEQS